MYNKHNYVLLCFFFQPISPDDDVQVPRIYVNKIKIVVVDRKQPTKSIKMTIEVWACFELLSKLAIVYYKLHLVCRCIKRLVRNILHVLQRGNMSGLFRQIDWHTITSIDFGSTANFNRLVFKANAANIRLDLHVYVIF